MTTNANIERKSERARQRARFADHVYSASEPGLYDTDDGPLTLLVMRLEPSESFDGPPYSSDEDYGNRTLGIDRGVL